MTTAHLIYGLPQHDPDLYYATHALVSDPLIYIATPQGSHLIAHDTEIDVLKRTSRVRRILSYMLYLRKAKSQLKSPNGRPTDADICRIFLKENGIRRVLAHNKTPAFIVDHLRQNGFRVDLGPFPFYAERLVKTPAEVRAIATSQAATFQAMGYVEGILRKSRISGNTLTYNGKTLTSEILHAAAKTFLLNRGYEFPNDIIIACGNASTEPHNRGSGPTRPHQSIIVDIFPLNPRTQFHGDATRTFCKGRPSKELQRMYLAVREAQEMAIGRVRAGVNGADIHKAVHEFFKSAGFQTGIRKGRPVGYIHGTGHGLGHALHEGPVGIGTMNCVLKTGNVVTVEPGLYYPGIGGVRIEDVVVVTKSGCKVLGRYPKKLVV